MDKKIRVYFNATTIGLSLVVSIFIGTGMGVLLDLYFRTKPYLTIIFMLLGIIAGYKNMLYFCVKCFAVIKLYRLWSGS